MARVEAEQNKKPWRLWRRTYPIQPPTRTTEEIANGIIDATQKATTSWLQEKVAEYRARYFRTGEQKFQDVVQVWVTYGVEYRPAPLFDQVRELTLTHDSQEDMLTVHAHLAAMDMIRSIREGGHPEYERRNLEDAISAFQNARQNPMGRYVTYGVMVRALTEGALDRMAAKRFLREVEFFGALRTIATRGRESDYTL